MTDMETVLDIIEAEVSQGGRVRIDAETWNLMEAALDAEGDDLAVLTKAFCAALWLDDSSRMPNDAYNALLKANKEFSFRRSDVDAGLSLMAPKATI